MRREMAEKLAVIRPVASFFLPSLNNLLLWSCRITIDHIEMNKPGSTFFRNVRKPLVSVPFTAKNQETKLLVAFPFFL